MKITDIGSTCGKAYQARIMGKVKSSNMYKGPMDKDNGGED